MSTSANNRLLARAAQSRRNGAVTVRERLPIVLGTLFAPIALFAASITPQSYLDHIRFLASDNLKGRATGSPELDRAAD